MSTHLKAHNFKPISQGRGGNNFGHTTQGRGRGTYYQERTNCNCFHYRKFEYKATNCIFKSMNQNSYQANLAENQYRNIGENSSPKSLFLASNSFVEDENTWYLDTGCNNHMCGKKQLFSSLDETVNSTIKFGNNTHIPIFGKGRISIKLKGGSHNFISNVFYAPDLYHNLLSMGQLSEKCYNIQNPPRPLHNI